MGPDHALGELASRDTSASSLETPLLEVLSPVMACLGESLPYILHSVACNPGRVTRHTLRAGSLGLLLHELRGAAETKTRGKRAPRCLELKQPRAAGCGDAV